MFSEKKVSIGNISVGSDAPVSVQSMYERSPSDADIPSLADRINRLSRMGLGIIRFSFTSEADSSALTKISSLIDIPIVADIHFDYKLALLALDSGASKIRINPGNIGAKWKTREIVKKAGDMGKAIRIGLNSGSLPPNTEGMSVPAAMVNSALSYIEIFESENFYNTVVSLKSSDNEETVEAARMFSSVSGYPIHLGVTEAGGPISSSVRSAWALCTLLSEGIGDTLRVSITGSMEDEVEAGVEILRAVGLGKGVKIISCPRCGRCTFDTEKFLLEAKEDLLSIDRNITIAVMGCPVNGPGEAGRSDYAVTGNAERAFIYKGGKIVAGAKIENAEKALLEVILG